MVAQATWLHFEQGAISLRRDVAEPIVPLSRPHLGMMGLA